MSFPVRAVDTADTGVIDSVGTPGLWAAVIGAVIALLIYRAVTRRSVGGAGRRRGLRV